jgi:hypothetical protein
MAGRKRRQDRGLLSAQLLAGTESRELLNADLKQRVTAVVPAKTKVQLVKTTSKTLRSIQKQPARVECYFLHPDVRYAA